MHHSTTTRRWIRATAAGLAALGTTALTGCSVVAGSDSLSDLTSEIGPRWDAFVARWLAPLADTGVAIVVSWIGLVVVARLFALVPGVRSLRLRRSVGTGLRRVGFVLVFVTPIATVMVTAFASGDSLRAYAVVSTSLGLVATCVLAAGLATRSRVDAKVIGTDGHANDAWSIDVLRQVKDLNEADRFQRVEKPTTPDLTDFIGVADRSGSGLAAVAAWLVQALFNSSPWMLQVTILDARSAVATLRRNGRLIDEVDLRLDAVSGGDEQHRKLLALAAAFTAVKVAERYPDVVGLYRARNWESVGCLALARISAAGPERTQYLRLARELEPDSPLAAYEEVFADLALDPDREALEHFMQQVEPLVNTVARMSDRPTVFGRQRVTEVSRVGRAFRRSPAGTARRGERRAARREGIRLPARPEPRDLLLRMLTAYTMVARNWGALIELEGTPDTAELRTRRRRIECASTHLVDVLQIELEQRGRGGAWDRLRTLALRRDEVAVEAYREQVERRSHPDRIHERMRARAAICHRIFVSEAEVVDVLDERARSSAAKAAERWLGRASVSDEIETRYSYACYLARTASKAPAGDQREKDVACTARRVRAARRFDDYYRKVAAIDPELMLLGSEPELRELVLPDVATAWDIRVFRDARGELARHGILDPADVHAPVGSDADAALRLVDASELLRAVLAAGGGDLARTDRLRAARFLIDDRAFTSTAFRVARRKDAAALAAEVARAVFWRPSVEETARVRRFLTSVSRRVEAVRAADGIGSTSVPRRPAETEQTEPVAQPA